MKKLKFVKIKIKLKRVVEMVFKQKVSMIECFYITWIGDLNQMIGWMVLLLNV